MNTIVCSVCQRVIRNRQMLIMVDGKIQHVSCYKSPKPIEIRR